MNDLAPEPSISQLTAKIDDVVLGFRWMLACFLILLSIGNICLSLVIESSVQMFRNESSGRPLSFLTMTLFNHAALLRVLTVVWPTLGILNLHYAKHIRNWAIGSAILVSLIGLQAILTWMACIHPLGGFIVGMPDAGGK